ncbi:MAG: hypothetical protein IGQ88_04090 [Gloeomargaritaceae cyanobacterium C42_A2020_066]|nr:hypothetical protein [Gloeomargaritaceae cyanobacterium C42_A2020_066]
MLRPNPPDRLRLSSAAGRLYGLTLGMRWAVALVAWLTLGSWSLWAMRPAAILLGEHFTWTSLRFSLATYPWSAVGLTICIGLTLSVLLHHSRGILWGLSAKERQALERWAGQIGVQGTRHPLWRWVGPSGHRGQRKS